MAATRVTQVSREQIVGMLEKAASLHGLSLAEFRRAGEAGELEDWQLREMWVLYGDALQEDAAPQPA